MLKLFLISGLLLTAVLPTLAQSAPDPLAQPGRFCVVSSYGSGRRPDFTLDYGVPSKTNKLPDEQAYAERFRTEALHSLADMLNYMDNNGWELIQTTAAASSQGSALSSGTVYQYIFRRKAGQ